MNPPQEKLRQEIAKLLWQMYIRDEYGIEDFKDVYEHEYMVNKWESFTEEDKKGYLEDANKILKIFARMIDEIILEQEKGGIDSSFEGYAITVLKILRSRISYCPTEIEELKQGIED